MVHVYHSFSNWLICHSVKVTIHGGDRDECVKIQPKSVKTEKNTDKFITLKTWLKFRYILQCRRC